MPWEEQQEVLCIISPFNFTTLQSRGKLLQTECIFPVVLNWLVQNH